MDDFESMSDDELASIAGVQLEDAPQSSGDEFESMSDEELARIAGVRLPKEPEVSVRMGEMGQLSADAMQESGELPRRTTRSEKLARVSGPSLEALQSGDLSDFPHLTVQDKAEQQRLIGLAARNTFDQKRDGDTVDWEQLARATPFSSIPIGIAKSTALAAAQQRLESGSPTPRDLQVLGEAKGRETYDKQKGMGEKLAEGVMAAPGAIAEWGLTGGAGAVGRQAAGRVLSNGLAGKALGAVGEGLGRTAIPGAAQAALGLAAGQDPEEVLQGAGSRAVGNIAFSAIGGPPGYQGVKKALSDEALTIGKAVEETLKGTGRFVGASQAAQEADYYLGLGGKGGTITRALSGDPKAFEDLAVETGLGLILEGGTRVPSVAKSRFEKPAEKIEPTAAGAVPEKPVGDPTSPEELQRVYDRTKNQRDELAETPETFQEAQAARRAGRYESTPEADAKLLDEILSQYEPKPAAQETGLVLKGKTKRPPKVKDEVTDVQDQALQSGEAKPRVRESLRGGTEVGIQDAAQAVHDATGGKRGRELNATEWDEINRGTQWLAAFESGDIAATLENKSRAKQLESRIDALTNEHLGIVESKVKPGSLQDEANKTGKPKSTIHADKQKAGIDTSRKLTPEELAERQARIDAKAKTSGPSKGLIEEPPTPLEQLAKDEGGTLDVGKVFDWTFGNRKTAPEPPVAIDRHNRLPDPQDLGEQKVIASTPRGLGLAGRVGKMLDPRSRADTELRQSIIARADLMNKGESIANIEAARLKGQYGDIFPIQKHKMQGVNGDFDAKVTKLTDGTFGFVTDIIESELAQPGSQKITRKQRDWINKEWKPVLEDAHRLLKDASAAFYEDTAQIQMDQAYFPRLPYGSKGGLAAPKGGSKPGARQSFQKNRDFATEAEGQEYGILYEPDVHNVLGKFITSTYRSIADTRLANDPALAGRTTTEPTMKEMRGPDAPAFAGKVYPRETAEILHKAYDPGGGFLRAIHEGNQMLKSAKLTFDMAVTQLQLLPMMATNPIGWSQVQKGQVKDILTSADSFRDYLQQSNNAKAAREIAQAGSMIGTRPDYLSASGEGELITKVPFGYGKAQKHFGEAVGNAITVAKIELWKAMAKDTPGTTGLIRKKYGPESWAELSEAIDNMVGAGRSKSIGVSDSARMAEGLAAIGPSYYRALGNQVSSILQRGVSGQVARRAVAGWMASTTAITVAGMLAVGLSWDEIGPRLVPGNPDFMTVPIDTGDGTVEVGFGGIYMAAARTLGALWQWDTDKDGQNPLVRFAKSREGSGLAALDEILNQRDYHGRPQDPSIGLAKLPLPSPLENLIGYGTPAQKTALAIGDFFGMNTKPVKKGRQRRKR